MKKILVWLVLALSLAGCGGAEVFETVGDEMVQSVMAEPREIRLTLPEEAVLPAMETDNGTIYICQNYDVSIQTLESGDLEGTIRSVSGFDLEDIRTKAIALGMIPAEEATTVDVTVTIPVEEPEPTWWEDIVWFFEGLLE